MVPSSAFCFQGFCQKPASDRRGSRGPAERSRRTPEHDAGGNHVLHHQGDHGGNCDAGKRLAATVGEQPEVREQRNQQGGGNDPLKKRDRAIGQLVDSEGDPQPGSDARA